MNEELRKILEMVENGVITADDAEELLRAMHPADTSGDRVEPFKTNTAAEPKKVSILVKDKDKVQVNMSIPISLLKMGLRLGVAASAVGLSYARNDEEAALLDLLKSIDVDEILSVLASDNAELPYCIVDVEEDSGRRVQVIIE